MAGAALTIGEVLEFLIRKGPGRSERELAEAIFGPGAKQQSVNQDVRLLVGRGAVERRGAGVPSDPYRCYPVD